MRVETTPVRARARKGQKVKMNRRPHLRQALVQRLEQRAAEAKLREAEGRRHERSGKRIEAAMEGCAL